MSAIVVTEKQIGCLAAAMNAATLRVIREQRLPVELIGRGFATLANGDLQLHVRLRRQQECSACSPD